VLDVDDNYDDAYDDEYGVYEDDFNDDEFLHAIGDNSDVVCMY